MALNIGIFIKNYKNYKKYFGYKPMFGERYLKSGCGFEIPIKFCIDWYAQIDFSIKLLWDPLWTSFDLKNRQKPAEILEFAPKIMFFHWIKCSFMIFIGLTYSSTNVRRILLSEESYCPQNPSVWRIIMSAESAASSPVA